MEPPELRFVRRSAAPEPPSERRIRQHAAPGHHTVRLRMIFPEPLVIFRCKDIPVVAHRIHTLVKGPVKRIDMGCIFIEFPLHPRMDDQFFHGIPVVDRQETFEFPGIIHAQPGLHRDADLTFIKDLIQKPLQLLRISQEPGPPPFRHHGLRRTAQVQVHLAVAVFLKLLRCPEEILRPVCQDLRHRVHPPVVVRQDILLLPGAEMPHLVRFNKRHKILVKSAEALVNGASEDPAGNALQRGQIYLHDSSISPSYRRCLRPHIHTLLHGGTSCQGKCDVLRYLKQQF